MGLFCYFSNTADPNIRVFILEIMNYKARFFSFSNCHKQPYFFREV